MSSVSLVSAWYASILLRCTLSPGWLQIPCCRIQVYHVLDTSQELNGPRTTLFRASLCSLITFESNLLQDLVIPNRAIVLSGFNGKAFAKPLCTLAIITRHNPHVQSNKSFQRDKYIPNSRVTEQSAEVFIVDWYLKTPAVEAINITVGDTIVTGSASEERHILKALKLFEYFLAYNRRYIS